ncbi:PRTRC system protein B [Flavobacterium sp. AED]|jgi:PRTRC genetic system protein B|uniref:PRTRC system protein B n=1 Tax=Flavobacterium sp. AED TaxID=1423323 RepID=UPI00057E3903|nr:PRTRC system protein B [Flavobacterium sp. AED]KIA82400.1 PRTRC system protein B [Flavobacterium sp. AED]
MKDITTQFGALYHPIKAFVVYQKDTADKNIYVEAYDMDKNSYPINAHPLNLKESNQLVNALDTSDKLMRKFLKPSGLLPKNVLYINPEHDGYAIWYTPAQKVNLFFVDSLAITNGKAFVPPLLWKASKSNLYIYAMDKDMEINEQTILYHAPFFNLYADGKVCMGTVSVNIQADCLLEEFIQEWEQYFFNSYFSHLIEDTSPIKGNIIQLWQNLVCSGKPFPMKSLLKNSLTIKKLLS